MNLGLYLQPPCICDCKYVGDVVDELHLVYINLCINVFSNYEMPQ